MQPAGGTQRDRIRTAFSLADLLWMLFFILLLVAILLPASSRARETAKRAVCRANLRGIGQSEHIYANDYQDWFPMDYFDPTTSGINKHTIRFVGSVGHELEHRVTGSNNATRTHPSRSMFLLIIQGGSSPMSFNCPSSGDVAENLRNGAFGQQTAAQPGINRFDFKGYPFLSYGYQIPFSRRGKPRESMAGYSRMPVNADKGPFFEAGTNGQPSWSIPDAARTDIAAPTFAGSAAEILKQAPKSWRPYNSRNHGSEGQTVLYMDGHAEFTTSPIAGVNNDNIYTVQTGFALEDGLLGEKPRDFIGPLTDTDAVIVP